MRFVNFNSTNYYVNVDKIEHISNDSGGAAVTLTSGKKVYVYGATIEEVIAFLKNDTGWNDFNEWKKSTFA